jgi:hypothetical protein
MYSLPGFWRGLDGVVGMGLDELTLRGHVGRGVRVDGKQTSPAAAPGVHCRVPGACLRLVRTR